MDGRVFLALGHASDAKSGAVFWVTVIYTHI